MIDKKRWIKKGKSKLQKIVFGRTLLIAVLAILQLIFVLMAFHWLSSYSPYFYGAMTVLTVLCVLYIFNQPSDPTVKLSWLVLVSALMPVGGLFFFWVQTDMGHRKLKKKVMVAVEEGEKALPADTSLAESIREEYPQLYGLTNYMKGAGGYGIYQDTEATYFPNGESLLPVFLEELRQAKHFIFLEYFIISEGVMWDQVREVLLEKVKEGVEVRLLYDGTNEFTNLPHDYPEKLRNLGINCRVFAPIRPFFSTEQNYRDHRKIAVIDGVTSFTGGINLADEYVNEISLYGYWKDTALMLKGEATLTFLRLFLEAWQVTEVQGEYGVYLGRARENLLTWRREHPVPMDPEGNRQSVRGNYVLPYGDKPLDNDKVGELVYIDILNHARKYVHIMTPYLIIDEEMKTALVLAARRGVEVCLILPHIPDKAYAFALAKTHYPELLEAGVKIYEFTPGFVHAKGFVSDDIRAVVGTINLDYRSLYHHFECACYMEDMDVIADIEADMQSTMEQSMEITLLDLKKQSPWTWLAGIFLKVLAPLL